MLPFPSKLTWKTSFMKLESSTFSLHDILLMWCVKAFKAEGETRTAHMHRCSSATDNVLDKYDYIWTGEAAAWLNQIHRLVKGCVEVCLTDIRDKQETYCLSEEYTRPRKQKETNKNPVTSTLAPLSFRSTFASGRRDLKLHTPWGGQ